MNIEESVINLGDLSRRYNISVHVVHSELLTVGNKQVVKLLHHTEAGYCISSDVFNEIVSMEERLSRLIIDEGVARNDAVVRFKIVDFIPFDTKPRVYFLFKGSVLVYIGKSFNIANRISTHAEKDFDRVASYVVNAVEIDIIEGLNIYRYKPIYNTDVYTPTIYFRVLLNNCVFE